MPVGGRWAKKRRKREIGKKIHKNMGPDFQLVMNP
jgi:hypothetical protein